MKASLALFDDLPEYKILGVRQLAELQDRLEVGYPITVLFHLYFVVVGSDNVHSSFTGST